MLEKCPDCSCTLRLTSYRFDKLHGKDRIGFIPIKNKEDLEEGHKLGELCPNCHWNSMGVSRKELE